ncbi:MAG: TetR/AcrR family transcriptional regulator [Sphingosinicella sp.]|nr:TetR/AcrR family transcriptional regulator [Sphingosinicella sp.]
MTGKKEEQVAARGRRKEEVRNRILDSLIGLLSEGGDINHDRVAERAGVGRRTVYRYFPDQAALMQPLWDRVVALAGPGVKFPGTMDEMIASLPAVYRGFDAIAGLATVVRSTPQGRAVRLAQKDRRRKSYTSVAADAVKDLPPEDRVLATALFQVLHTTPWLEMRDHWDLGGDQIARVCGWAIEVLLKDLAVRGGKPLAEGAV